MSNFAKTIWHLLPAQLRHWLGRFVADSAYPAALKIFDVVMDRFYGVNTRRDQHEIHIADARRNIALSYVWLIAIRRSISLSSRDIVVDLGCGDGRALFVFANSRASKVRGIELDAQAIGKCKENIRRFHNREKIEFIISDCTTFRFVDETVVYFYNPFGVTTLRRVLVNLRESLGENPRPLKICFYGPETSKRLLDAEPWLKLVQEVRQFKATILIYEAR